jgi:hypothetical protein
MENNPSNSSSNRGWLIPTILIWVIALIAIVAAKSDGFKTQTLLPEDVDFRDFKLGMSREAVVAKLKTLDGYSKCKRNQCQWQTKIVGTIAKINFFLNDKDKNRLMSIFISYDSNSYQDIKNAMIIKYGQPSSIERKKIQTAMGATLTNENLFWFFNKGKPKDFISITVSQYGKTIKEGFVLYANIDGMAYFLTDKATKTIEEGF